MYEIIGYKVSLHNYHLFHSSCSNLHPALLEVCLGSSPPSQIAPGNFKPAQVSKWGLHQSGESCTCWLMCSGRPSCLGSIGFRVGSVEPGAQRPNPALFILLSRLSSGQARTHTALAWFIINACLCMLSP